MLRNVNRYATKKAIIKNKNTLLKYEDTKHGDITKWDFCFYNMNFKEQIAK